MAHKLILTQEQARVIAQSIRQLNTIGAAFGSLEFNNRMRVELWRCDAGIVVTRYGVPVELYANLADFEHAYALF